MLFLVKAPSSVMNFNIGNPLSILPEENQILDTFPFDFFLALKSISQFNVLSEELLSFKNTLLKQPCLNSSQSQMGVTSVLNRNLELIA